jgi:hypothetical protein
MWQLSGALFIVFLVVQWFYFPMSNRTELSSSSIILIDLTSTLITVVLFAITLAALLAYFSSNDVGFKANFKRLLPIAFAATLAVEIVSLVLVGYDARRNGSEILEERISE